MTVEACGCDLAAIELCDKHNKEYEDHCEELSWLPCGCNHYTGVLCSPHCFERNNAQQKMLDMELEAEFQSIIPF